MFIKLKDLYCNLVYKVNNKLVLENFYNTNNLDLIKIYPNKRNKKEFIELIRTKLTNTPHYQLLNNNNKYIYDKYLKNSGKYAGYGIEHSLEVFESLIKNFKYELKPLVLCTKDKNKYVIHDGLHRACLFLHKYGENYEIEIKLK